VGWAFVALPESPIGGQHLPVGEPEINHPWCWYDRPDHPPGPTIAKLAASSRAAVVGGGLWTVDRTGHTEALTLVAVDLDGGTSDEREVRGTGTVAMRSITPEYLASLLVRVTGDRGIRSTNSVSVQWMGTHEC
jgi:hypothetical protein